MSDLLELDLAVDAAMGIKPVFEAESYPNPARSCATLDVGMTGLGLLSDPRPERIYTGKMLGPFPSQRWSTNDFAVGAMLAWISKSRWSVSIDRFSADFEPPSADDEGWFCIMFPYCLAENNPFPVADSIPHALALGVVEISKWLAVVEVAKREAADLAALTDMASPDMLAPKDVPDPEHPQ